MGFKKVANLLTYEGDVVALRLETDKGQFIDLETDYVENSKEWIIAVSNINVERLSLKPHKDKLVTDIEISNKKTYRNVTNNKLWADKAVEFVVSNYTDLRFCKECKNVSVEHSFANPDLCVSCAE